jgi:anti-sigma factor RsiW
MKNVNDELLNKYIDGELSVQEIDDLEKDLTVNPDLVDRLKAIKMTDTVLKTMEHDSAPRNIANRIMQKIESVSSVKNQKPYFVYGIGVFIVMVTLAAIGIVISMVPPESVGSSTIDPFMDKVTVAVSENASIISDVLQNPVLLLIGASLTLLSLITAYYLFDSHKTFKKRLNTVTH